MSRLKLVYTLQSMELNGGHSRRSLTPELKRRSVSPGFRQKEIGALEIAAEQVKSLNDNLPFIGHSLRKYMYS